MLRLSPRVRRGLEVFVKPRQFHLPRLSEALPIDAVVRAASDHVKLGRHATVANRLRGALDDFIAAQLLLLRDDEKDRCRNFTRRFDGL